MRITWPLGEGTVLWDCPHMFVGVCEKCRDASHVGGVQTQDELPGQAPAVDLGSLT